MRMRERGIFAWLGRRFVIGLSLVVLSSTGLAEADHRFASNAMPVPDPLWHDRMPHELAIDLAAEHPAGVGEWADEVLSATPNQGDPLAAVDACLQRELSQKGLPGASMAIAVDGALAHTSAFGVRRVGAPERVDTETIFRINSTTKMMGAAAVMQLVEQGRLDLHAPITDYVPELKIAAPWSASSLTLHTLLGNAGAVPDPFLDFSLMPERYEIPAWAIDLSGWAGRLSTMHLYAPPGSFWNYSSPNFSLAGLAVERVSGMSWEDYVIANLFRPAGMVVATFDPEAVVASGNYATGHYASQYREPAYYQRIYAAPAGGAYTTPSELITWALQLAGDGGEILSPESVRAMTTKHYKAEAVPWTPRSSYGYGIFIDDYRRIDDPSQVIEVMRHPGNGRGYGTELVWAPELGFAVATLINGHSNMHGTVDCALRLVAGLEPVPLTGQRSAPATWGRYAGTYAIQDLFGARWTAHVAQVGNQLRIHHPDWALVPAIAEAIPHPASMSQLFYHSFRYTYAGEKTVTFEPGGADPSHSGWLRNQRFVGQRVGQLPERLEIEGQGCATLDLTAGLDVAEPRAMAYGLVEPRVWTDEVIAQEDPADPASSRFKVDLEIDSPLGFLSAWLFEDADDNLELYLMQDQDGDGEFAWPGELVERLTSAAAQGMFVAARQTPGPYQIWVHGAQVAGTGSVFRLDVVAIVGEELRVQSLPEQMSAGQAARIEVCAEPGAAYERDRVGLVEIDFGAPGAIGRVPVYWTPGEAREPPNPSLYLPLLLRRGS